MAKPITLKTIRFNWRSLKSVVTAQRLKTRLENRGYNLIKSKEMAEDKWVLTFKHPTKR